jgi:hypothetical protein
LRGSVVRLTPNSGKQIVGTLSDISDSSLSLPSDTGLKVIPRNSIRKLEWRDRDAHRFCRSPRSEPISKRCPVE